MQSSQLAWSRRRALQAFGGIARDGGAARTLRIFAQGADIVLRDHWLIPPRIARGLAGIEAAHDGLVIGIDEECPRYPRAFSDMESSMERRRVEVVRPAS